MKSKKAIFFSTDALIAVIIIFLIIIVAIPTIRQTETETKVHSDTMQVLSNLKIGEIDNPIIQAMIENGDIQKTNNTILEQIGEFYVTNKTLAKIIGEEILSYLETENNIGIWYNNELIALRNSTPYNTAKNIEVERQLISGLSAGNDTTGFAARAYLSSDLQTKYFYFGGYIGDGNITAEITYDGTIQSAEMELVINNDFETYINGISVGNNTKSDSEYSPKKYTLPLDEFQSGTNSIELRGENLHIAGGLIKITYEGSQETETTKYKFSGIRGLINIYDSFYGGELQTLSASIHLNTPYDVFLSIGNKTVFENSTEGEETIILTNEELSAILDYDQLKNKTVPIRFALRNASYFTNITLNVDSFSVTDLSGSMEDQCIGSSPFWCCWFGDRCSTQTSCLACDGIPSPKITAVKQANNAFIEGILGYSGNNIGLAGYRSSVSASDYHDLSDDEASLKSEVESWDAGGGTCICCGINKAIEGFTNSPEEKLKTMVVMSDGRATDTCDEQGTGDPDSDAIQAACEAFQNNNITVHSVAFGTNADVNTLRQIATCGNGTFYSGNVEDIISLYETISQDIIEASYNEQTISASEEFETTILYPDSYIEIGQTTPATANPGMILTLEKQFDNNSIGTFNIPQDSTIISARAISYSGPWWTDSVSANGNNFFQLSQYGTQYIKLGDPYAITIPIQFLQENNSIQISTALSPINSSEGSIYNKIIYQIGKNSSSYSSISPFISGCIWNIEFEDNSNATIKVPADYNGITECYYTSLTQNYDDNDALQGAVYKLLKILDVNLNNKVDTKLSENNLQIVPNEITGIPLIWSSEVQIRIWN